MITISLCMIVKDEEDVLSRCLGSVHHLVEEINIIDTGSTDATKMIASEYTNRIFDFRWIDHFAKARNFSFEKATMDYILWLDADDVFLSEDQNKLFELKKSLSSDIDSVTMKYILGIDEHGNITNSVRRNRLVKRTNHFQWHGMVHEYLQVAGNIYNSDISIWHKRNKHYKDRNLALYEKQLKEDQPFTPRDMFYFANELKDHQIYDKAINMYDQFLLNNEGWIEDNIAACASLADCYHQMNDKDKELSSILRSFQYDKPRPEFCCRLGFYFLERGQISSAIYWYEQAIHNEPSDDNWGVNNPSYTTWLPNLQLCVCHDRLGNYEAAYHHNEIAYQFRPTDPAILHNKTYLESIIMESTDPSGEKNG